jgi:succinyl-CoA synthetase beta subunit
MKANPDKFQALANDKKSMDNNIVLNLAGNKIKCETEVKLLGVTIDFDDNALYRHEDIIELRDTSQEDEKEKEAGEYQLNYISLDGTIGFTKTPPTFASV